MSDRTLPEAPGPDKIFGLATGYSLGDQIPTTDGLWDERCYDLSQKGPPMGTERSVLEMFEKSFIRKTLSSTSLY